MIYTLKNKRSKNPLLTFKPEFFVELLKENKEASTLAYAKLVKDLKQALNCDTIILNPEQEEAWYDSIGSTPREGWISLYSNFQNKNVRKIINFFEKRFLNSDVKSFEENLQTAKVFFEMVDNYE